jgi:hypothetical protein
VKHVDHYDGPLDGHDELLAHAELTRHVQLSFAHTGAGFVLQFLQNGVTQIWIADGLIMRSPIGNGNTILIYFGTSTVELEASFNGQLFFAPNAQV